MSRDSAVAFFEPERILSAEHPPRSPLVNALLNPFIAAPVFLASYALALYIGKGIPAVEYNTIPDFIGGHLYLSKALFFAMAFAVIFACRRWPAQRDIFNLLVGLAYTGLVLRWLALPLLAWVVVIYYAFPKLNSHLALLLTATMALVSERYLPRVPIPGYGYYYALVALRLTYYAFERRGIRKKHLSLAAAYAYNFGILWWNGPDLAAYATLHTPKPREVTDRQSARMFYWTALKFVLLAVGIRALYLVLPDPMKYDDLFAPVKVFAFVNPWLTVYWLRTFVGHEVGIGLANMAGYYMHDLMIYPLLAPTPLHYFRRHNLTTLNFYRRVVIYEIARRFKNNLVISIAGGMGAAWLHHFFIGMAMDTKAAPLDAFLRESGIPLTGLVTLLIAIYMSRVYDRVRPLAQFVFLPTMWVNAAIQNFDMTKFWYGFKGLDAQAWMDNRQCYMLSTFTGQSCHDTHLKLPLLVIVPAFMIGVALLVDGLGFLIPALRTKKPAAAAAPPNSKAA